MNEHFLYFIFNLPFLFSSPCICCCCDRLLSRWCCLCINWSIETKFTKNKKFEQKIKTNLLKTGNERFDEYNLSQQSRQAIAKQFALPANPLSGLLRAPCECRRGVCGCCTGMLFSALRQLGCMNITYSPEDFSFEFKMIMNNAVLYNQRVTGRNPPPVCVRMPRFSFLRMCASFYDLYFVGRNMHVCMEMSGYFQDSEVFNRFAFWINFAKKEIYKKKNKNSFPFLPNQIIWLYAYRR